MVIAGPGNAAQVWDAETLRRVGSPLDTQRESRALRSAPTASAS